MENVWKGMLEMLIKSGQEALFIACEMERGAIQIYERALMLTQANDPKTKALHQQLLVMLGDEQEHLKQFQSLYQGLDATQEEQLMLSAEASTVLFEGGLLSAVRKGMLKDEKRLIKFAAEAEKKAAETYRVIAEKCSEPYAADILCSIASEEEKHLFTLLEYLGT